MAIQGKQVPMYINIYCFCIFWFFNFFYEKKIKENWKINNQNISNKAMHKTKLTQNTKAKHTSNAKKKKKKKMRERRKKNHLEPFSFHTLEEPFRLTNPWFGGEGEELKLFKFERNMRVLRRSPRGANEDGNWF